MKHSNTIPAERIGQDLIGTGSLVYPEAISTYAAQSDSLFYFIFWASLILLLGLIGAAAYFIWRSKKGDQTGDYGKVITHSTKIEVIWTVIPTLLVLFIFYWGFKDYISMRMPKGDVIEIKAKGQKWQWGFDYGWGQVYPHVLTIPVNTPIKLVMISTDVLHSFYIPNLRVKRDVIPNRYTTIWFEADKEGSYQIFCTEYCGLEHWKMLARMDVVSEEEYDKWTKEEAAKVAGQNPVEHGRSLYQANCASCHSIDGTAMACPTWKGLYGSTRSFTDGSTVKADENYLKESIYYPTKKIVNGYKNVGMPAYLHLSQEEVDHIIEYIKTVK